MKVLVLHHPTITPGTIVEATDQEAADLIRTGRGIPAPVVETAEAAPPENAARTHKPTPRGSARSFSAKKG